jgi:DUF4097 and DUF4098 domain-containing protein YvlB
MKPRFRTPVLAALALVLTWTSAEASVTVKQPFQQSYPLKPGGSLEVRNTNGGITVTAWDRNEVRVDAVKEVRAPSTQQAEELAKQIRIDVQQTAGRVRIVTRLPRDKNGLLDWLTGNSASFNVTYKIQAPRDLAAKLVSTNGGLKLAGTRGRADLETVNGGVTVERVEGEIHLESTNGALNVIEPSGTLEGSTTNGGITAHLTQVDGDISLATTNGGVTLKVARDIRASLDVAAANGGIHSDLDVQGGEQGRKRLVGEVNGGGSRLKIRTTNGGVRIAAE